MNRVLFFLFLSTSSVVFSQNDLNQLLKKFNNESIPYITVATLKKQANDFILLDAREKKEFNVSHLKNAQFVGYDKFNLRKTVKSIPDKNSKIVVYCSLGIRSEDIAEKLKKAGYTNVSNLYGGIFEWKNKDCKVYDSKGQETEKVHAFSLDWGIWLTKGIKIYE